LRIQQVHHVLGFQLQQGRVVTPVNAEKIVKAAAMGLIPAVQMTVQGGDIPPPPSNDDQQNKGAEVVKMIPVEKKDSRFLGKRTILNITAVSCVKERVPTLLSKRVPFFIEKIVIVVQNPTLKVSQLE
jgi:hypothetical protein